MLPNRCWTWLQGFAAIRLSTQLLFHFIPKCCRELRSGLWADPSQSYIPVWKKQKKDLLIDLHARGQTEPIKMWLYTLLFKETDGSRPGTINQINDFLLFVQPQTSNKVWICDFWTACFAYCKDLQGQFCPPAWTHNFLLGSLFPQLDWQLSEGSKVEELNGLLFCLKCWGLGTVSHH